MVAEYFGVFIQWFMALLLLEISCGNRTVKFLLKVAGRSVQVEVVLAILWVGRDITNVIAVTRVHQKLVKDSEEFLQLERENASDAFLDAAESIFLLLTFEVNRFYRVVKAQEETLQMCGLFSTTVCVEVASMPGFRHGL